MRGALNKVANLPGAAGVITASAGNHGMSVAYAARRAGRPCTVVVPTTANPQKVQAIAGYGAKVVQFGQDYFESYGHAVEIGKREKLDFVHAFDDPDTSASAHALLQ